MAERRSASGLVLPGIRSTAWMLGLAPVPAENTWLDRLAQVYLVARDYLVPFEAARGRVFDREQWISVLLTKYPAEEYLCQLAALNHASNSDELTAAYLDRFLDVVAVDAAAGYPARDGRRRRAAPLVPGPPGRAARDQAGP